MEIIVEIKNSDVLPLLKELEKLNLIQVKQQPVNQELSLSEKFAGKLSNETAAALHEHISQTRDEWDRSF